MRKTCHISFSSHEEVLFRSREDINYGFNCIAIACMYTESRLIADSEMTTHLHLGVQTDSPKELFHRGRYAYSRYFNSKYHRHGNLGEKYPFILETGGLLHTQTMVSYICRQGLHHGLTPTPFAYPHNSVNSYFRKELGKADPVDLMPRNQWYKYVPDSQYAIPDGFRMDASGLLLREDVVDVAYVQLLYVSPRNFLYQMNRLSDDRWEEEQTTDKSGFPPVTLDGIEPQFYSPCISQMLINESGRSCSGRITDLELCSLIDNRYVPQMGKVRVYDLTLCERESLGNTLIEDYRNGRIAKMLGRDPGFPDSDQIKRCAAIW